MLNNGYAHFAEALVFVHGRHAAGEAARHALLCEKSGDTETAAYWRKLQNQLTVRLEKQDLPRCA
ncbi:MAG: hypothetical protein M3O03_06795 [Pseudomonadota bacterium]|nr:hypothetical protein [Pseudomonadota bacterium]